MFCNNETRQNNEYGFDENINIDINNANNIGINNGFNQQYDNNIDMINGSVEGPIIEPGRERIIQKNIIHEVKHACFFLQDYKKIKT